MPLPSGVKAEIEFVSGAWVDVTADVDYRSGAGYSVRVGRTSATQTAQTSTLTLTLHNPLGKYTPGLAVLTDGSAAPYYPNVKPRRRVRITTNAGAVVEFLGYIKKWAPIADNGAYKRVVISAADVTDRLSKVAMRSPIAQVASQSNPPHWWPLTDPVGSTAAADAGTAASATSGLSIVNPSQAALVFGSSGPGVGDGTGVQLNGTSGGLGQYLQYNLPVMAGQFTLAVFFNTEGALPSYISSGARTETLVSLIDASGTNGGEIHIFGSAPNNLVWQTYNTHVNSPYQSIAGDSAWHLLILDCSVVGGSLVQWLDNVGGSSLATMPGVPMVQLAIGGTVAAVTGGVGNTFNGNIGQVILCDGFNLTSTQRTALWNAVNGYSGETVDARIQRFLGYAGLAPADYALDASTVVCSTYPQAGKSVADACQDLAVNTEGGGSVFYVKGGVATFKNRSYRKPAAPAVTIDAQKDLDAQAAWQPSHDDANLVNQAIVTRATASGTQSTQTVNNAASQAVTADGGPIGVTVTTYTATDTDALNLAQSLIQVTPQFRLPQVCVDMLTAAANLYASIGGAGIGDRVRINNIPAGMAPASTLDFLIEGWTKDASIGEYKWTADLSPADNPPRFVWDDTTYGRWGASGLFLRDSITSGALSLVVANNRTNLCTNPSFETNTTGWAVGGTVVPTITQSAVRAVSGADSMLTTWGTGGSLPLYQTTFATTAGQVYTVSAWVYVPTGSPNVILNINNGGALSGSSGATKDAWVRISQTFTATATTTTTVQFWPGSSPTAGQQVWTDAVLFEASSSVNGYIDTTSGDATLPVFTQAGGAYPLLIAIDAEVISITSAPGSSTSPQTFTVTRGASGTAPAAHAGGATVLLAKQPTWTL